MGCSVSRGEVIVVGDVRPQPEFEPVLPSPQEEQQVLLQQQQEIQDELARSSLNSLRSAEFEEKPSTHSHPSEAADKVESDLPGQPSFQILYVERPKNQSCEEESTVASSKGSGTTARALPVLQARGTTRLAVFRNKLPKEKLEEFNDCLRAHGVDTSSWGVNGTKSIEHLFWEVFVQRGCIITKSTSDAGKLKRVSRMVRIRIIADIFGVEHVLQSRLQFMHDGQCIERQQVLMKCLVWEQEGICTPSEAALFDSAFTEEDCSLCESWVHGAKAALTDRLGLSSVFQGEHLEEDLHSHTYHIVDNNDSGGFPGLVSLYCIHEMTIRVINTEAAAMNCLGLPTGEEFATTEGDFNLSAMQMQNDEDGLPLGTQLNIWTWVRTENERGSIMRLSVKTAKASLFGEQILIKRIPLPDDSARQLARMSSLDTSNSFQPPSPMLCLVQRGRKTDWPRAQKIAHRIADPEYSLREFTDDLQAFPELDLYLVEEVENFGSVSGRTLGDEFQRTIGAFYAIYWLMRLGSDGKDGFSFGVDDEWKPIARDMVSDSPKLPMNPSEKTKRINFFEQISWQNFERVLIDAELLVETKLESGSTTLAVNEDRVLTLLALTAMHDVMKVQALLPTVQEAHSPYHGYSARDTISDHDHALCYLMDHFPKLLPSYDGLCEAEKFSVAFTQCQLQFNQGWFVQAEAPPGAIFKKFKELLIRDHQSKVEPRDIALYFVHWLTDLAGAEPTPLGGCEKFVIKFPLVVLNSFLNSLGFVEQLACRTETEVMEEYLKMRWLEHTPPLGEIPTGHYGIAKMRLICMAQMNSVKVLQGFDNLANEDKDNALDILSAEMARTGCMGQNFSAGLTPPEVQNNPMGPALLIYYGPAFLQSLQPSCSPSIRLRILAEVYRGARELWPLTVSHVGLSVTIRVDTIKALSNQEIADAMNHGKVWVMVKHNELEAFVELSSMFKLNKFIANQQPIHILEFDDLIEACM